LISGICFQRAFAFQDHPVFLKSRQSGSLPDFMKEKSAAQSLSSDAEKVAKNEMELLNDSTNFVRETETVRQKMPQIVV
jgi:hypothetical protein